MNKTVTFLWTATLLLALSGAWAQDADEPALPAAEKARDEAQLPAQAANGLATAAGNTANRRPAEATIRLMDDADDEDGRSVINTVELPMLPDAAAAGQKGLDTAAEAKARGKEFGQDRVSDAVDNARELAEEAQNAAEGRGRAEDLPGEVPGRPNPNRPDRPRPDRP